MRLRSVLRSVPSSEPTRVFLSHDLYCSSPESVSYKSREMKELWEQTVGGLKKRRVRELRDRDRLRIKSHFSVSRCILLLAEIRRLVVQIKAIEKVDQGADCAGAER